MLPLSKNWIQKVKFAKAKRTLKIRCGILRLYYSNKTIDDDLIDAGFLNFVLTDKDGTLLGYPIKEIENTPIVVESMEGMKPNASSIADIWVENNIVYAIHWDGFTSRFDANSMQLIGQKFTH